MLAVSLVLLDVGCAANRILKPDVDYDASLVTGERLFGTEVSLDEVPDADLLSVSDTMSTFVAEHVGGNRLAITRFKRLLGALGNEGYFNAIYDPAKTQNAAETFDSKSGNCLSYTTMFIALSRVSGLEASYQVVDVPPTWDADSGFLIRYTHINALLRNVQVDRTAGTTDVTIDFNTVQPDPQYERHLVSDDYAAALFYANRSVDHVRRDELRSAFAYLRKAISLAPYNPDLWVNLGAIYAKSDDFLSAVEAYEVALTVDPGDKGAISGLARAWGNHGDAERAEVYAARVKRYRERNPFFHFAVAQAEYEGENYDRALEAINTAIDLRRREGEFHFLKGLTLYKLGDLAGARQSFSKAERYGRYRDLKLRYLGEYAGVSQPLPN
jgi:Flp pilus assembly protein TadD